FPSFEELYLMSNYKIEVLNYTKTILPDYNDLIQLHDKALLKDTVNKAGLYYPETFVPENLTEVKEIIENIDYPVYIKMRQSRNSTGIRLVDEPSQIMEAYHDVIHRNNLKKNELPIIQQKIKGPEFAESALAQNGEVIGETFHVGLRYIPRSGGTTTSRTTKTNDNCSKSAAQFIKHINWTGFISIDYILDEFTGKAYIIDVNTRPSVCINVGYYGGVDMLPEWIKIAQYKKAKKLPKIKENIKSSTHFADIFWYLLTFVQGPESRKKRKKMRQEWKADRKEMNYDIISKNDKKPRFVLNLFLATQMIKLIFTKLEASNLFLHYNTFNEELFAKLKNQTIPETENSLEAFDAIVEQDITINSNTKIHENA
ncbi:MAG: hypothetical protein C0594_11970, partial [Marinilabiliales bacterium]